MSLSDAKIRTAKLRATLWKLSDGGGLQLWVQPTGGRLWRFAYRFVGKQKLLSLGAYPIISLSAARELRDEAKRLLVTGVDPSVTKREAKAAQADLSNNFRGIAKEYIEKLKREGRAETTIIKIEWLLSFAYPSLGARRSAIGRSRRSPRPTCFVHCGKLKSEAGMKRRGASVPRSAVSSVMRSQPHVPRTIQPLPFEVRSPNQS